MRYVPFALCSILLSSLLVLGCQTSRSKELEAIHPGMSKPQVLNAAGGPNISDRREGQDRWIYVTHGENTDTAKEVRFKDDRAVYVGEPIQPKVSADEQDRLNELNTASAEARERAAALDSPENFRKYIGNNPDKSEAGAGAAVQKPPTYVPLEDLSKSSDSAQ